MFGVGLSSKGSWRLVGKNAEAAFLPKTPDLKYLNGGAWAGRIRPRPKDNEGGGLGGPAEVGPSRAGYFFLPSDGGRS